MTLPASDTGFQRCSLDAVLRRELDLLTLLHQCISNERAALEQQDLPLLEELTTRKGQLLDELSDVDSARMALFDPPVRPDTGIDVHIEQPLSAEQRKLWDEILDITRNVADLTRMNGVLVTAGLAYCRHALAALSGKNGCLVEYDATGQTKSHAGSRTIGSA